MKFSASTTATEKKSEGSAKSAPQAYIFIGRDKYRATEDRTPQDWRKLFVCLSRMARDDDGREISQNEFGLGIVYDALETWKRPQRKLWEQVRRGHREALERRADGRRDPRGTGRTSRRREEHRRRRGGRDGPERERQGRFEEQEVTSSRSRETGGESQD